MQQNSFLSKNKKKKKNIYNVCVCVCVCKTRVVLLLHCTEKVYSEKGYLVFLRTIFSVQHLNTRIYTHI